DIGLGAPCERNSVLFNNEKCCWIFLMSADPSLVYIVNKNNGLYLKFDTVSNDYRLEEDSECTGINCLWRLTLQSEREPIASPMGIGEGQYVIRNNKSLKYITGNDSNDLIGFIDNCQCEPLDSTAYRNGSCRWFIRKTIIENNII